MGRERRKRSKTGIYHIMLRGIDGRNIFMDDEDREKFIKVLFNAKEKGKFLLYAYCLMGNHVHLLIKEYEDIGTSIKRITVGYVQWHNNKYARTGHLFQNRFKSEVVESEAYLLTVIRYIHQNPVKAKIVGNPSEYEWSSYNKYINSYNGKQKPSIDTDIVKGYFHNKESYKGYMSQANNDECLKFEVKRKYTDIELKEKLTKQYNIDEINSLNRIDRDKLISDIKKEMAVSIRQLSRVLGVGRGIIEKATKK